MPQKKKEKEKENLVLYYQTCGASTKWFMRTSVLPHVVTVFMGMSLLRVQNFALPAML